MARPHQGFVLVFLIHDIEKRVLKSSLAVLLFGHQGAAQTSCENKTSWHKVYEIYKHNYNYYLYLLANLECCIQSYDLKQTIKISIYLH